MTVSDMRPRQSTDDRGSDEMRDITKLRKDIDIEAIKRRIRDIALEHRRSFPFAQDRRRRGVELNRPGIG